MCGIIGVVALNDKSINIGSTLIEGIKRLDYRGYDSWGIALYDKDFDTFSFIKRVGECDVEDNYNHGLHQTGIGHTRWATNGKVSNANAHPHMDENFTIVHNGIIENVDDFITIWSYERDMTDTEVLLHWIEEEIKTINLADLLRKVYNSIKGDNAFIFEYKGQLIVMCRGKELYLGKNEDSYIIASEVQTLSDWCDECIKLDNMWAIVDSDSKKNEWMKANWRMSEESIRSKEGERMFKRLAVPEGVFDKKTGMIDEIYQQPDIIYNGRKKGLTPKWSNRPKVIVGCGSSYNAALFGRMCFNDGGIDARAEYASEYKYWNDVDREYKNDLIVISQSGETKDTLDILYNPLRYHPFAVIVNNENSKMARENYCIHMKAGPEFAVAATKSFTMSCMRLLEMAVDSRGHSMRTAFNNYLNCDDFSLLVKDVLSYDKRIEEFVYASDFNRCLFLGSKYNYPMAREGALKMKEVAYIPSDAMPSSEVKHGPIALVDKKCLSVFVGCAGKYYDNMCEVKSRGSQLMFVGPADHTLADLQICNMAGDSENFTNLNTTIQEALYAILNNIPLQLLAYHTAIKKGINPDRPRNLAKTVTV